MPGPFPGMDPYLEDPLRFPSLHQSLITTIAWQLNTLLPKQYAADMNERIVIETQDRSIYPDVTVIERLAPRGERGGVATVADPSTMLAVMPVEMREVYVEILALGKEERLVTTIEILSPTNKRAGTDGRKQYVEKQQALLASDVHLMEIDLLRTGAHTVAAPDWKVKTLGRFDYLVVLHRSDKKWHYQTWANRMRDRLPRVEVPLLPGDPDVILDLQACFDQAYDNGPYSRRIDYTKDPAVPLAPDDAVWTDALLREKGLR
jgi:hypothetical protein